MLCVSQTRRSGFSLVEVLVVAALSVVIFGALFSAFKYSLNLISDSRAKLSALSIANDRMEYFRSLPYEDVGVVSGYPSGTIQQNSTTTLNGIEFAERVRVDYVDDPADGTAGADSNGIILDYKQVRLEYTWSRDGSTSSIEMISNIVPRSIETTAGGGTARINVLDADASLLPGASVRLFSSSSTFSYDVTTFTDSSGAALFNVPADSGYQVEVTANISGKPYSMDQTYVATTSNPIPVVAPFAVLESDISTLTFQIGELSDLAIATYSAIAEGSYIEGFTDLTAVASSTNVAASGAGELVLGDSLGIYETSGIAYIETVSPSTLENWETVRIAVDLPVNTSHKVQVFTGTSTSAYTLVPDIDLPGNAAGFTDTLIDISLLNPTTYTELVFGITLETTNTTVTPAVDEISIFYRESAVALPAINLGVQGGKIIGTETDATPIYKYETSVATDSNGEATLNDIEFDDYTFTQPAAYDIAQACPAQPFTHQAGINGEVEFLLVASSPDTLRVSVVDVLGRAVPGARVHVSRAGYDTSIDTQSCGQAFFAAGLGVHSDYTVEVTASGFTTETLTNFSVDGDTAAVITLNE